MDTGGTFTDLVVAEPGLPTRIFKQSTTPSRPTDGIRDVLLKAATGAGMDLRTWLSRCELMIHGTTHPINAILTNRTARTAFLTTAGHPDVLTLREGGRTDAFDHSRQYPRPYIPRRLTFEIQERIDASGRVVRPISVEHTVEVLKQLHEQQVEAIAVALLWSPVNPAHEIRLGELIAHYCPGVPFTLSHQLNPAIREYRRASSAAIDASLKPMVTAYLSHFQQMLQENGFTGQALMVTSGGGLVDLTYAANAPIHLVGSGPAMAPVAGRYFSDENGGLDAVIVADTGGTTFDVSLVRRGRIPRTRETWIGPVYTGHMTGFPSVDVRSLGAGGGSIAWVDAGGLLRVGPDSAGSNPGPVAYDRGGARVTVTDAALVLGHLDADYFLGGEMRLRADKARVALEQQICQPLGYTLEAGANAIRELVTQNLVTAIEDITVHQGVDSRLAQLVGGGGAAGLNIVPIAKRLGCKQAILPNVGATLSAAGALLADLSSTASKSWIARASTVEDSDIAQIWGKLRSECHLFLEKVGDLEYEIEYLIEARYPHQVWTLEVPLSAAPVKGATTPPEFCSGAHLAAAFHEEHKAIFSVADVVSDVEITSWHARISCKLPHHAIDDVHYGASAARPTSRKAYFPSSGEIDVAVHSLSDMTVGEAVFGPAFIETPVTTAVIDPGAIARRTHAGSIVVSFEGREQ